MSDQIYNVLFLCTHNSARSLMAEAILNNLAVSQGRFKGFSAGSHPSGKPNPFALAQIQSVGLPTEGLRSKDWDEFAMPGGPNLNTGWQGSSMTNGNPRGTASPSDKPTPNSTACYSPPAN